MRTLVRFVVSSFLFSACKISIALNVQSNQIKPTVADQILLINTRGYPTVVGRTLDFKVTQARKLNADGTRTRNLLPLDRSSGAMETWVFVHGNQITPCEAIRRGLTVYRNLRSCARYERPIRFVIWSWPSERKSNRIKDSKEKAARTDVESFLLGSYLTKLANQSPTSIIAYSFGARIVSGALHLAAGGQLSGYRLPDRIETYIPFRLVFIAAAVENNGLHPCGRYGRGLNTVESLFLINNSRDKALNFFWIINNSKPKAMGNTGIVCAPGQCQIQQHDWTQTIGRGHSLWQYIDRPATLRQISKAISR